MIITKFGHCCLAIEVGGLKILTDPGEWSSQQNKLRDIDVVLITHEHSDHLHIDSVKKILLNNRDVHILTNKSVGKILNEQSINYELLEDGQSKEFNHVLIEAFGQTHARIYGSFPDVINTGYLINKKLFYPGDAFHNPQRPVEILALPVAGPWCKISEAIDYAKAVKPKVCFPVHDGMLNEYGQSFYEHPKRFLGEGGINFITLTSGGRLEV